ncbi:MAG TPA: prepilin-type N-terminal cleavage/methylation domain-containing protein, partial [Thermoanaerobaculia bacterium]|nr:prepilin-type N-terminal cleavage/methylation domain-containing protein [Thermoanaerobaculia bacterium]
MVRALSRQRGFTLVELLLVLALSLILLIAVLNLFDGMNRMTRVQVNLADLQQAQRVAQAEVVRMVRMAGRGGLREDLLGGSVAHLAAVTVRNNVGAGGVDPVVLDGSGIAANEGSDVLVLRGVFSTPIYRVDYVDPGSFDPVTGRVVVALSTPTGVPQDLGPLREAVEEERPEALVITDALGDAYGVAELLPGDSVVTADSVLLAFRTSGSARAERYAALSSGGAFPAFQKALSVGILEEHRFYVRPGDPDPVLARTRTYPNVEEAYPDELDREVAPNIRDLQVALGFDSSQAGGFFDCDADPDGDDDRVVESDDGRDDDWLFNAAGGAAR